MKSFNFEGSGFEYFKIWIVNLLLTIVTLGLYYPWAKVRNKRYIYANSTLENRSFDYHATGKQLFIGYLISMGLFIAYFIIQQVSPTGSLIVLLLFLLALPWIVWRSLIFNMRVTSFSNVRFSFGASVGGAYFNYMLLPILFFIALYSGPILIGVLLANGVYSIGFVTLIISGIVVLIGIALAVYAFAYLKKRNVSYVINGTNYGQGSFSTDIEASGFIKILIKTIGLFFIVSIIYMILVGIVSAATGMFDGLLAMAENINDPQAIEDVMKSGGVAALIIMVYFGFILISILVLAYSFTRQRAYIFANTKLDNKIKLASTLSASTLVWISISNFLAIICSLGLAIPWATVRITRYVLQNTEIDTSIGFEDYVSKKEEEQSSLGEQIGDAFDVDVGLGI